MQRRQKLLQPESGARSSAVVLALSCLVPSATPLALPLAARLADERLLLQLVDSLIDGVGQAALPQVQHADRELQ